MKRIHERPWLSDSGSEYVRRTPFFFDTARIPEVRVVEENFHIIRDELLRSLQQGPSHFEPYGDLTKTDKKDAWKTAGLMYWTLRSEALIRRYPETWRIMRKVSGLSSCSFLVLEPHSTIKAHIGDTDAMYRCHLGLVIPAPLPQCGFRVGDETRSWVEGRVFAFNDACEHTAWNNTDHRRYILSFDVFRPEFAGFRYWTSSHVLGKVFVEIMGQHVQWVGRLTRIRWLRTVIFLASKVWWYIRVRLHALTFRDPVCD